MISHFSKLLSESLYEAIQAMNGTTTYYHGGDARYGLQLHNNVLWLTEDPEYAKLYAKNSEQPAIFEVIVDDSKMSHQSIYELEDYDFDELDDPSDEVLECMHNNGTNYWCIESANGGNGDCIALIDTSPILSYRQLSKDEYDSIKDI